MHVRSAAVASLRVRALQGPRERFAALGSGARSGARSGVTRSLYPDRRQGACRSAGSAGSRERSPSRRGSAPAPARSGRAPGRRRRPRARAHGTSFPPLSACARRVRRRSHRGWRDPAAPARSSPIRTPRRQRSRARAPSATREHGSFYFGSRLPAREVLLQHACSECNGANGRIPTYMFGIWKLYCA